MITMNVWGSVTALCRQLCDEFRTDGLTTTAVLFDFEGHANTVELPNTDLIGPVSFAIEESSPHIFNTSFAIGISTVNDEGLFRHREMMARLFERLRPERTIDLYDAETAQVLGYIKLIDGTTLLPMSNASVRAFQFIQADALVDPLSASPS